MDSLTLSIIGAALFRRYDGLIGYPGESALADALLWVNAHPWPIAFFVVGMVGMVASVAGSFRYGSK